jgi:hypothetical protein
VYARFQRSDSLGSDSSIKIIHYKTEDEMKSLFKFVLCLMSLNMFVDAKADVKCWVVGYLKKDEGSFSKLIQATSKQDAINFFKKLNPRIEKVGIDGDCDTNIPEMWRDRNMPDSARTPNSLKAESSKVSAKNSVTDKNETQNIQSNNKDTNSKTAHEQAGDMIVESMKKNGLFDSGTDTNDPAGFLKFLEQGGKVVDDLCDKTYGPKERQERTARNKSRSWQVQAVGVAPNVVTSVAQTGWDECTGAAVFKISHKTPGTFGSSTIKCGFGETNYLSSTSVKAQCR